MTLFHPVDEDTHTFEVRPNMVRINANFAVIDLELEQVNVGTYPNDATGDTLREGWIKVNRNFLAIEKAVLAKN